MPEILQTLFFRHGVVTLLESSSAFLVNNCPWFAELWKYTEAQEEVLEKVGNFVELKECWSRLFGVNWVVLYQIKRIVMKGQCKQIHVSTGCILPMLQFQTKWSSHASNSTHTHSLPCDAVCTVSVIVILSVRPSVCHTRGLCPHCSTYDHDFFTTG